MGVATHTHYTVCGSKVTAVQPCHSLSALYADTVSLCVRQEADCWGGLSLLYKLKVFPPPLYECVSLSSGVEVTGNTA